LLNKSLVERYNYIHVTMLDMSTDAEVGRPDVVNRCWQAARIYGLRA